MNDQEILEQAKFLIDTGTHASGAVFAATLARQGEVSPEGLRPLIVAVSTLAGSSSDRGAINAAIDTVLGSPEFAPHRHAPAPQQAPEDRGRAALLAEFGIGRQPYDSGLRFRGEAATPQQQAPATPQQQQPVVDARAALLAEFGLSHRATDRTGLSFK